MGGARGNDHSDAFHSNAAQNGSHRAGKRSFSQASGPPLAPASSASGASRNINARQRKDSVSTVTSLPDAGTRAAAKRNRDVSNRIGPMSNSREGTAGPANKGLKRTLTDFRIESLEIVELGWKWKALPLEHASVHQENDAGSKKKRPFEKQAKDDTELEKEDLTHKDVPLESPLLGIQPNDTPEAPQSETDEAITPAVGNPTSDAAKLAPAMQRGDSRKEKRKHSEEQDEDETGETTIQEGETASKNAKEHDQPIGKKVKGDTGIKAEEDEKSVTPPPVEHTGETQNPAVSDETDPSEEALDLLAVPETRDEPVRTGDAGEAATEEVGRDESPNEEEEIAPSEDPADTTTAFRSATQSAASEDDSGDEVAASVIARAPSLSGTKSPVDSPRTEEPPRVQVSQAQTKNDSPHGKNRKESLPSTPSIPSNGKGKKFRENSRLRIYFSSTAVYEQKMSNRYPFDRLTPQMHKRVKREKEMPRQQRAESVESRATQQDIDRTDDGADEDDEDDVDGEPIAFVEESDTEERSPPPPSSLKSEETEISLPGKDKDDKVKSEAEPSTAALPSRRLSEPSADRISISYARNSRRLVIDAEAVEELSVHRVEAKIEMKIKLERIEEGEQEMATRYCRGLYVGFLHSWWYIATDNQFFSWKQSSKAMISSKLIAIPWKTRGPRMRRLRPPIPTKKLHPCPTSFSLLFIICFSPPHQSLKGLLCLLLLPRSSSNLLPLSQDWTA